MRPGRCSTARPPRCAWRSRDRGQSFTKPVTLSAPAQVGPAVTYVYPSVDAAGDVYVSVVSFPPSGKASTIYVARSSDDGRSWSRFVPVTTVGTLPDCCLPNTTFRDGIVENFAASPTYPGHLYLTYEEWDGAQFDVKFTQSTDAGLTWTDPVVVNDNADPAASDQFQPSVAAGPAARWRWRSMTAGLPARPTRRAARACEPGQLLYRHLPAGLQGQRRGAEPVGGNVRISEFTWDPEQPGQTIDGIDQMACAAHQDPCQTNAFIGDYFGLAISGGNIYALMVSTHYPSGVTADDGGPVYYQQVLATVPRGIWGRLLKLVCVGGPATTARGLQRAPQHQRRWRSSWSIDVRKGDLGGGASTARSATVAAGSTPRPA